MWFRSFEDFWLSQTPRYTPTTKIIAAMSLRDRQALMEAVEADLRALPGGVGYSARANAVRGIVQPDRFDRKTPGSRGRMADKVKAGGK